MVAIEEIPEQQKVDGKHQHPAYTAAAATTIPTVTRTQDSVDQFNQMMGDMNAARQELVDNDEYDSENPLTQAIEMALAQGRGWGPGEKQAYLERILADDFIPPLFASSVEEVEEMGLKEAFTTLQKENGDDPALLMVEFKKKGNKAFADGKRNQVSNVQYYRDAINRYYEALAWSQEVKVCNSDDGGTKDNALQTTTQAELDTFQSTLYSNIALCHLHLHNWGLCRNNAKLALQKDATNGKAQYRLAKALVQLQDWEAAGAAIEHGLLHHTEAKGDFEKLQAASAKSIQKARRLRQQRERARAERVAKVKAVYQHCQEASITLGRIPLVTNEDDDDDEDELFAWHHHLPHSGLLPSKSSGSWSWPCLCLYPSHQQSDLITAMAEDEMLAVRMAEVFPELEDTSTQETSMPWDTDNLFTCSQLAVYFEVHSAALEEAPPNGTSPPLAHPDAIQRLTDQASCMRFYEATRALKGDEGTDVGHIVRLSELQQRQRQQAAWKRAYGSLHANHYSRKRHVVRVHPAMTLRDLLQDARMIVPNFLVTLIFIPEDHPAHVKFLHEYECVGILQPSTAVE